MFDQRETGSRLLILLYAASLLAVLAGCGEDESKRDQNPGPEDADRSLVGTWKVDWHRTLDAFAIEKGKEKDAAGRLKALLGDFELAFTPKTVTVSGAGDEEQAAWSTASTDGDTWVLRGPRSDLTLRWLDTDTFQLIQDEAADGTKRGLILARQ